MWSLYMKTLWDNPALFFTSRSRSIQAMRVIMVTFLWIAGFILYFTMFADTQNKFIKRTKVSVHAHQTELSSKTIKLGDTSVYYQTVSPLTDRHDFALIWLHGAAFSSQTWIDLRILQNIAIKQGFTSYAIDVPGYGKSSKEKQSDNKWLIEVIDKILKSEQKKRKKFVLVTASMSGAYAIPLLMKNQQDLKNNDLEQIGLIAVAPIGTEPYKMYKKEDYEAVTMPIGIIYGEKDTTTGLSSMKQLSQTKSNMVFVVPDGIHACYRTDPVLFTNFTLTYLQQFE